jgi:hypothetical protein
LKRALTRAEQRYLPMALLHQGEGILDFDSDGRIYTRVVRDEVLKTSGLYPDYSEKELIATVQERVAADFNDAMGVTTTDTDEERGTVTTITRPTELAQYVENLPPHERQQVLATVKADLFAKRYVEATVDQGMVPPLSPAQPGRWQRIRQMSMVRNSPTLTRIARFCEMPFSDKHYERGLWAKITRDLVPGLYDMWFGTVNNMRRMPISLTVGYLTTLAIWGPSAVLPVVSFAVASLLSGPLVRGGWNVTVRLMRMLGLKPAAKPSSMAFYGTVGSWMTLGAALVMMVFRPELGEFVHHAEGAIRNVVGPQCAQFLQDWSLLSTPTPPTH